MRRSLAVALVAALAAPVAAGAAEHDVLWFEGRPAARAYFLKACRNDLRLAHADLRCANAERAETRAYARQMGARSGAPGRLPAIMETPLMLDAARVACAKPPSEWGLFAAYCGKATPKG